MCYIVVNVNIKGEYAMPLMEVVLRGELNGQQHVNRFNYIGAGTPAAVSMSFALTSAMGFIKVGAAFPAGTIFAWMVGQLSTALTFSEVEVRNVYSVTDFYLTPFASGTAGTYAGEATSPTLAYGFRTNRVRTDIRRGTRRFGGVVEATIGAGGVLAGGIGTSLDLVADLMSDVLTYTDEGNTLTFTPCVVKREGYETPSGGWAYRYMEDETEQLANVATSIIWAPYPNVRTQVSRQYGRGR